MNSINQTNSIPKTTQTFFNEHAGNKAEVSNVKANSINQRHRSKLKSDVNDLAKEILATTAYAGISSFINILAKYSRNAPENETSNTVDTFFNMFFKTFLKKNISKKLSLHIINEIDKQRLSEKSPITGTLFDSDLEPNEISEGEINFLYAKTVQLEKTFTTLTETEEIENHLDQRLLILHTLANNTTNSYAKNCLAIAEDLLSDCIKFMIREYMNFTDVNDHYLRVFTQVVEQLQNKEEILNKYMENFTGCDPEPILHPNAITGALNHTEMQK